MTQIAFQNSANAATAGSGICLQTYTLSAGNESVTVTSDDNYCYIAFKNLGAAGSTSSSYVWSKPNGISSLDVLVIGGGGGGGSRQGGGGGAGSFVQATSYAITSSSTNINVVVGAGGAGGPGLASGNYIGSKGNESSFKLGINGLTALGGGGGINGSSLNINGGSGGGGGGLSSPASGTATPSTQKSLDGISTITGIEFGQNGAPGVTEPSALYDYWAAGGGGGASGAGKRPSLNGSEYVSSNEFPDSNGSLTRGGAGGIGKVSSFISSTIAANLGIGQNSSGSIYFSGGGGGGIGADAAAGGLGGIGGGGDGTRTIASGGIAGLTSTGGGGGGSGYDDRSPVAGDVQNPPGGPGGSGVVVIRYLAVLPTVSVSLAAGDLNFRTAKSISATPTAAGKLTFRANSVIIPGCKNLTASANIAKSCSYKPNTRGNVVITVTLVPTDSGFSSSTTRTATYFVYKRIGSR